MDNLVAHEYIETSSSDEEEDEDLLSNNVGLLYNNNINNNRKLMNDEYEKDYNNKRNKYFTPEITKVRILIDTGTLKHTENYNTSHYTINFTGNMDVANYRENNIVSENNMKTGYKNYRNVIGFKLIKAMLYNSTYIVTEETQLKIIYMIETGEQNFTIKLDARVYTVDKLTEILENKLNNAVEGLAGWTLEYDNTIDRFKIMNNIYNYKLMFEESKSEMWRLLGARNKDTRYISQNEIYIFEDIPHHNRTYVDLVIDEIPYKACKQNTYGHNVVERIPIINGPGDLVVYNAGIDNPDNYFYPIDITKLTIKLYDNLGNIYHSNNSDNSFEFELTILER